MTTDTPTLRAGEDGFIQIALPLRQAPASARLSYIAYQDTRAPLIALRLAFPGRRIYLLANPLLPAHREALHRLSGQSAVRLVDAQGQALATLFQPEGARQNLRQILQGMPTNRPTNAADWQISVQEVRLSLPAAAEIPALLEGVKTGDMGDLG